jgi:pumilio homology domain family member 6
MDFPWAPDPLRQFLVIKLIRFCPSLRQSIFLEFRHRILRLLLHREASGILATAFDLYANAYERSLLSRDFYGKEVALFSSAAGSEQYKEQGLGGLHLLEGVA